METFVPQWLVQGGLVGIFLLIIFKFDTWMKTWNSGKLAIATIEEKGKLDLAKQMQDGYQSHTANFTTMMDKIEKNCNERTESTNKAFDRVVTCVDKNTEVTTELVTTLKDKK